MKAKDCLLAILAYVQLVLIASLAPFFLRVPMHLGWEERMFWQIVLISSTIHFIMFYGGGIYLKVYWNVKREVEVSIVILIVGMSIFSTAKYFNSLTANSAFHRENHNDIICYKKNKRINIQQNGVQYFAISSVNLQENAKFNSHEIPRKVFLSDLQN